MAYEVQREDLLIPQGATYRHVFAYVDSANAPVDITGYTARMQIRATISATAKLYESAGGDFVINGVAGEVILTIASATTTAWTWATGVYDIEIVSPLGEVTRLIKGKVKVDPEVTR